MANPPDRLDTPRIRRAERRKARQTKSDSIANLMLLVGGGLGVALIVGLTLFSQSLL